MTRRRALSMCIDVVLCVEDVVVVVDIGAVVVAVVVARVAVVASSARHDNGCANVRQLARVALSTNKQYKTKKAQMIQNKKTQMPSLASQR